MEQSLKRSKIVYTVLAVLLAVGVLPVTVAGWKLVGLNRDTLSKNEQQFQIDSVEDKAKQIKLYVSAYRDQINAFARSLEIAGGLASLGQSELRDEKLAEAVRTDSNLCALLILPLKPNMENMSATNASKITDDEMMPIISEVASHFKRTQDIFVGA